MMKRLTAITMLTAAALAGCSTPGNLPAPNSVAESTKLDENIGRAATNAYTAASTLGRQLAIAGHIDKSRFKALDQKGYDLVLAIKAAYDAGNSSTYLELVGRLNAVVVQMKGL